MANIYVTRRSSDSMGTHRQELLKVSACCVVTFPFALRFQIAGSRLLIKSVGASLTAGVLVTAVTCFAMAGYTALPRFGPDALTGSASDPSPHAFAVGLVPRHGTSLMRQNTLVLVSGFARVLAKVVNAFLASDA